MNKTGGYNSRFNENKSRGHLWKLVEWPDYQNVDIFGYSAGTHNGPRCVKCGYCYCHHCVDGPERDCTKPDNSDYLVVILP